MDVDFGSSTAQLSGMTAQVSDTILPSSSALLPIRLLQVPLKIFFSGRSMLTLVALVQLFQWHQTLDLIFKRYLKRMRSKVHGEWFQ